MIVFFFQAEDGIRDIGVTGVQTCALPIFQAVGFALFNPARMAYLAELVPRGSVPQAVSLLLVNTEVRRVVGPALAGVGIGAVSWGTAAGFLASPVAAHGRRARSAAPAPGAP